MPTTTHASGLATGAVSVPPLSPTPTGHDAVPTYVRHGGASNTDLLAGTEWLLTNGHGGFAMGTAIGAMARRYHGMLIASLQPPTHRVMAL
ncbi:MAG: glycogen debranching enzyme N-terminal domain-containing protein, partial [Phycisphaerales bacterium]